MEASYLDVGTLLSIGLIYVGIVLLIYFIHFIAKPVQINVYIDNITNETIKLRQNSKKMVYSSVYISGGEKIDYINQITGCKGRIYLWPRTDKTK